MPERAWSEADRLTLDAVYNAFAAQCKAAWDSGIAADGLPRAVASVTLPEGVLPGLSQMLNPLDKTIVPVVRVPLCALAARSRHTLCDEVHQVTSDGVTGSITIRVSSTIPPPVLRPALGAALADVVRAECYPPSDGDS